MRLHLLRPKHPPLQHPRHLPNLLTLSCACNSLLQLSRNRQDHPSLSSGSVPIATTGEVTMTRTMMTQTTMTDLAAVALLLSRLFSSVQWDRLALFPPWTISQLRLRRRTHRSPHHPHRLLLQPWKPATHQHQPHRLHRRPYRRRAAQHRTAPLLHHRRHLPCPRAHQQLRRHLRHQCLSQARPLPRHHLHLEWGLHLHLRVQRRAEFLPFPRVVGQLGFWVRSSLARHCARPKQRIKVRRLSQVGCWTSVMMMVMRLERGEGSGNETVKGNVGAAKLVWLTRLDTHKDELRAISLRPPRSVPATSQWCQLRII